MKKYYILDTNVLLHDPSAITHFEDNDVLIPLKVIEEIDKFKREISERGRNARQVARKLDELRRIGRLSDERGVELPGGGRLRVCFPRDSDPLDAGKPADDIILRTARETRAMYQETPVIMVSKDINLRLKADALGLQAEDYENGHTTDNLSELYSGRTVVDVDEAALELFREERRIEPPPGCDLFANQYVTLRNRKDAGETVDGRYDAEAGRIVALIPAPDRLHPIRPRNPEQFCAMDALLNDRVKLVTLSGKAGTGKTLLAVAAGVLKTFDEKTYEKLLISRPTFPVGKDLGYLPGSLQEKLEPWMQPIYDALDLIRHGRDKPSRDLLVGSERIAVEPLSYIRGRSIPNQFMIVDEAQNLTPLEVKTVITRVGHGTKIVLTGDIYQIDNPYVDVLSNGLNALVEKFKQESLAAHIELREGVRSRIAELAANLL